LSRTIGIFSVKGGVGKTTVVINLGALIATKYKKNVVIVDCNITTSHLSLYLGMYYSPITLNKVLRDEVSIYDAIYDHFTGVKVIPASLSLTDLKGVDITRLKDVLSEITDKYDLMILDAAPGLGRESLAAIRASDEIIFVSTPYIVPIVDIVRGLQVVKDAGVKPMGIVLNMVKGDKYELTAKEITNLTGLPVIASIPYDENVLKSLNLKTPVVELKPFSKTTKGFDDLSSFILGESVAGQSFLKRFKNFFASNPKV
jgi:cell division ATPase MinD